MVNLIIEMVEPCKGRIYDPAIRQCRVFYK
ncbi:MAG: hypothetical protein ACEQSQ_09005 [Candidatus Paceibacteria bacterium]